MSKYRHPRHYALCFDIIQGYEGEIPFALYLKKVFKNNKSWGSTDRKSYRDLSYLYLKNKVLFDSSSDAESYRKIWQELETEGMPRANAYDRFQPVISDKIDIYELNRWFHSMGPIFLHAIHSEHIESSPLISNHETTPYKGVFKFSNLSNVQPLVDKGWAYIQDISSFRCVYENKDIFRGNIVWDCCSGSGGKSLTMSKYAAPKHLICSDVRQNILENLKNRFEKTPYKLPEHYTIDILSEKNIERKHSQSANVILADVPCSGSGTWRRSPEQLNGFDLKILESYSLRQKQILKKLMEYPSVETIVYCTCSVFENENEYVVQSALNDHPEYILREESYFGGPNQDDGDYLYCAVLHRPLEV